MDAGPGGNGLSRPFPVEGQIGPESLGLLITT